MRIMKIGLALALAAGLSAPVMAQSQASTKSTKSKAQSVSATPKAGKGEKVCRHTHPSGQKRVWVCKKAEPCCAWDLINYVKCGSTVTGCL
jgi:hypothetical protein